MTPAPQPAIDKALADKDRLWRRYRAQKKQQYETLFAIPIDGPLLKKFSATLGHFGIEDADRMVAYVQSCHWLKVAHADIRFAALEMISHRIVRIRQRAGLCEFDDSLDDAAPDVFQICKRELGL